MRLQSSLLPGAMIVGCALVAVLSTGSRRQASEQRPDADVAQLDERSALPTEEPLAQVPRSERTESAAPDAAATDEPAGRSARDFLAEYYGNSWPEIEARIQASGTSLDIPYVYTPWEDVEPEFARRVGLSQEDGEGIVRNLVAWPSDVSDGFLREEFELAPAAELEDSDLHAIDSIVAQKNEQIVQLARHFADLTDAFVKERWRTGNYVKAPYTTAGISDQRGYHAQSHGGRGWAVSITLPREDYPEIDALEEEIAELGLERSALVRDYLRTHIR